ncbi:hypothetical protein MESS4_430146 [Mesorhizobium sp. STM 4661]|nr:hypothetical protein MESS4_430146 [Mesorhizobium sp. STM 4661]
MNMVIFEWMGLLKLSQNNISRMGRNENIGSKAPSSNRIAFKKISGDDCDSAVCDTTGGRGLARQTNVISGEMNFVVASRWRPVLDPGV